MGLASSRAILAPPGEAPRRGKTIYELDPWARGAVDDTLLSEDPGPG